MKEGILYRTQLKEPLEQFTGPSFEFLVECELCSMQALHRLINSFPEHKETFIQIKNNHQLNYEGFLECPNTTIDKTVEEENIIKDLVAVYSECLTHFGLTPVIFSLEKCELMLLREYIEYSRKIDINNEMSEIILHKIIPRLHSNIVLVNSIGKI